VVGVAVGVFFVLFQGWVFLFWFVAVLHGALFVNIVSTLTSRLFRVCCCVLACLLSFGVVFLSAVFLWPVGFLVLWVCAFVVLSVVFCVFGGITSNVVLGGCLLSGVGVLMVVFLCGVTLADCLWGGRGLCVRLWRRVVRLFCLVVCVVVFGLLCFLFS